MFVSEARMATTEQPKVVTEEAKIDLFEDDDEFEEFDINRGNLSSLTWTTIFLFSVQFLCSFCYISNP